MFKRFLLCTIMAILLAATGVFTACTQAPVSPPSPAATTKVTGINPSEAGPVRGGILRSNILSDPPSFDPHSNSTHRILALTAAVFSGLVKANPQKAVVSVDNLIPDLAERWEVGPDGKTYTFYLRQGVKFHDGHPFTAEDVKYSLDRFRDSKTSAFAGGVENIIDNVAVVNDYTVKINLKFAYSDLLLFLLPPYCSILPAHLKDVSTKSTAFLVGTGPFKYKASTPGKVYEFTRNPDYFVKGLPYLDGYEVYVIPTPQHADAFVGGRLDTAGTLRQLLEDRPVILKVKEMAPEAIVGVAPNGANRGLLFNLERKGPWQDKRVRQAMAMVLDYQGAITAAIGGPEAGFSAPVGIVPINSPESLSQQEISTILGLDKPLEERIAKAKQLMKDAGYANGFSATCSTDESSVRVNPALFASDLWKRYLNIDMKVESMPSAVYLQKESQRQFEMAFLSLVPTTGISVVENLAFMTSDSARNLGKWSNPEYDQLFQQISREMIESKKKELAIKAQRILFDEMPYIVFHETTYGTAVRPDMRIGWPAVKAPVLQAGQTSLMALDSVWFAGTPDASKWIKNQN
jgi:peptide/nickel transport system substrate-binding protein